MKGLFAGLQQVSSFGHPILGNRRALLFLSILILGGIFTAYVAFLGQAAYINYPPRRKPPVRFDLIRPLAGPYSAELTRAWMPDGEAGYRLPRGTKVTVLHGEAVSVADRVGGSPGIFTGPDAFAAALRAGRIDPDCKAVTRATGAKWRHFEGFQVDWITTQKGAGRVIVVPREREGARFVLYLRFSMPSMKPDHYISENKVILDMLQTLSRDGLPVGELDLPGTGPTPGNPATGMPGPGGMQRRSPSLPGMGAPR